jgi:hypothetical protein
MTLGSEVSINLPYFTQASQTSTTVPSISTLLIFSIVFPHITHSAIISPGNHLKFYIIGFLCLDFYVKYFEIIKFIRFMF